MTAAPETRSHYTRIGGQSAVRAVVDRLFERLLDDADLRHHFALADVRRVKQHFAYKLTAVLGGPDHYQGENMGTAHAALHVTDAAFDRFVGHLVAALAAVPLPADLGEPADRYRVTLVRDVAPALEAMRPQVVERTPHSLLWQILHPRAGTR